MENVTEKIFKAQLNKLPSEVIDYISSADWEESIDKICSRYNLSDKEVSILKREVTLTLAGLTHPDFFHDILKKEVGLVGEILDTVTKETEEKIFAPIRPILVNFFENENAEVSEEGTPVFANEVKQSSEPAFAPNVPIVPLVPSVPHVPRIPDVAPDNLPTGEPTETEPLIPPIPPKNTATTNETPTHPFEEQMKKVFTAGNQSMGDLTIEPPAIPPATPATPPPRPTFADPYREPIE